MEVLLQKGRYHARLARSAADVQAALDLRRLCFRGGTRSDADGFDATCEHLLVERQADAVLLGCCRVMARGYVNAHYDMRAWADVSGPVAEMGRFCLRPGELDPDVLRVAWAALAGLSRARGWRFLVGCTSFEGVDAGRYRDGFALLRERHLGPVALRPAALAPEVVRFGEMTDGDATAGMAQLPPLLRSYLGMGGWVGDHAVVDRDMNSLHVFTALEISAVPDLRRQRLLALSAQ